VHFALYALVGKVSFLGRSSALLLDPEHRRSVQSNRRDLFVFGGSDSVLHSFGAEID
jgi:hypothetical protein